MKNGKTGKAEKKMENREWKAGCGKASNVSNLWAVESVHSRLLKVGFFQVVDGGFVEVGEVHAQAFAESHFA